MRRHQITIAHLQQMRPHLPARQPDPTPAAPDTSPTGHVPAPANARRPKALGIAHAVACRAAQLHQYLAANAHRLTSDELEQVVVELRDATAAMQSAITLMLAQTDPQDAGVVAPALQQPAPATDVLPQPDAGEPAPPAPPTPAAPAPAPAPDEVDASRPQQRVTRPAGLAQAIAARARGLRRHIEQCDIEYLSDPDLRAFIDELTAAGTDIVASQELIERVSTPRRLRTRDGQPLVAVPTADAVAGALPTT
ncbi:hypothetical protein AB0B31_11100 [Catellatospora citrea]|uniref:hypothetical protein n=1 Tax=Catellatospora citrea TaxID=53366 RepID=UPI0033DBC6E4